jgi:hypothetical protein
MDGVIVLREHAPGSTTVGLAYRADHEGQLAIALSALPETVELVGSLPGVDTRQPHRNARWYEQLLTDQPRAARTRSLSKVKPAQASGKA